MKKGVLILAIALFTIAKTEICISQTNVPSGVYVNTTWTLSGSPYIITDTVVVFPNVILTIEPGVVVKFNDDAQLEIRQGKLIANGTVGDSITFTSNSSSPSLGIYSGILLNGGNLVPIFNFCNFIYADNAISTKNLNNNYTITIKNSNIFKNNMGCLCTDVVVNIDSSSFRQNTKCIWYGSIISNSIISKNQEGLNISGETATIINCIIDSNYYGVKGNGRIINSTITNNYVGSFSGDLYNCTVKFNNTGIIADSPGDTVQNCIIDSNSVIGIKFLTQVISGLLFNCEIKYNGIGVEADWGIIKNNIIEDNIIGIKIIPKVGYSLHQRIFCNKICNNSDYGVDYNNTDNISLSNNYWCTSDSALISNYIKDGYDDVSFGLIDYMPIDTEECYLNTAIIKLQKDISYLSFSPNPFTQSFTITYTLSENSFVSLKLFDVTGKLVSEIVHQKQNKGEHTLNYDARNLSEGIYFSQLQTDEGIETRKIVKQ